MLLAAPAYAWEAIPGPICTLAHDTSDASVRVTYDPRIPEYAISLSRSGTPWPDGPVFAIRFDGPRPLTITTDRHVLSDGQTTLTVTDSGFTNVLNGLQFNTTATALIGETALPLSLEGATPAVEAFRACTTAPSA
ncbi:MAG: excinuclease ABC subunit B [Paracoccaceae bacterium]